ncbi:hypothetical protein SCYAM73S_02538 [Streptomyces cyaneofuscatus]
MRTTSAPSAMPSLTASYAIEAGSPPSGPRTVRAPTRSPQVWSRRRRRGRCRPRRGPRCWSATRTRASLPVVVVLPAVDADDHDDALGLGAALGLDLAVEVRAEQGDQLFAQQGAGLRGCGCRAPGRARGAVRRVPGWATPTSAVRRVSSISSQVSSSRLSRTAASSPLPSEFCERASRARSRTSRPSVGSGSPARGCPASTTGASSTGAVASGRPTSSMVRRASSRGRSKLLADLWLGGRSDGRRGRGRGRQLPLLAGLPTTSPPTRPTAARAMTTARMTISTSSITRPVSATAAAPARPRTPPGCSSHCPLYAPFGGNARCGSLPFRRVSYCAPRPALSSGRCASGERDTRHGLHRGPVQSRSILQPPL